MSDPVFRSALAHRNDRNSVPGLSIGLTEISDRGMIDLRGVASDKKFAGAVKDVLGVALCTKPRSSASAGDITVLWLSIDQWLITCPRSAASDLHGRLVKALDGIHSLAVDVSDMRAIFRLEGDNARVVLNKGTSVDFTDGTLGAGSVRRLRYAEIAAAVHVISDAPCVMDMYLFRSYADYAWSYLSKTAAKASEVKLFGVHVGISA